MKDLLDKLKGIWKELPAKKKRLAMGGALLLAVVVLANVADNVKPPQKPGAAQKAKKGTANEIAESKDVRLFLTNRRDPSLDDITAKVDAAQSELARQKGAVQGLREDVTGVREGEVRRTNNEKNELVDQLRQLQDEVKLLKGGYGGDKAGSLPPPPGFEGASNSGALPGVVPPPVQAASAPKTEAPAAPVRKIRVSQDTSSESDDDSGEKDSSSAKTAGGGNITVANGSAGNGGAGAKPSDSRVTNTKAPPKEFIPAGTIIQGVLLNGMDAPTHSVGQQNPVPALMRVKADAILPNKFSKDIKECFIILSGFGELASERAKLRTEVLSCVRQDGGVLEAALDGYAIDDDGKAGIKGRVVTKQGAVIAKTLLAGMMSGIAQGIAPQAVNSLNVNPGSTTQYQSPNLGMVGEMGLARGMSNAANEVAKFYMEMAREMYPVIEVNNLTPVTVVLVRGAALALGDVNKLGRGRR